MKIIMTELHQGILILNSNKINFFNYIINRLNNENKNSSIYKDYQSNLKNQEKTLAILKKARKKDEIQKLNKITEDNIEPDFWDKVGGFFGIFKCSTKDK